VEWDRSLEWDGSVRMRDGSLEDEDKGCVGKVACMRRRARVSRGGSGHHRRGWVLGITGEDGF